MVVGYNHGLTLHFHKMVKQNFFSFLLFVLESNHGFNMGKYIGFYVLFKVFVIYVFIYIFQIRES